MFWSNVSQPQCSSFWLDTSSYQKFQSFLAVPSITPLHTGKCTCAIWWYIKLFKIGILGNFPIAHDSLWVLEVMFIEKKFECEEVLHCIHMVSEVWSGPPSQNPLKSSICTGKHLLKFNNFFYKHDLITPKISLCYRQMVFSAYFIFPLFIFQ
jgi:hypothetical protein